MVIHSTLAEREVAHGQLKVGVWGVLLLILILALVGAGLWGLWLVGRFFWRAFAVSPPAAQAAIIAGAAATVVLALCLLRIGGARPLAVQRQELLVPRAEFYEEFLQSLLRTLEGSRGGRKRHPAREISEFLSQFGQRMLIWGSDEVLRAYARLGEVLARPPLADPDEVAGRLDDLLFAIRRELGYTNVALGDEELWRIVLPDHDRAERPFEKAG